MIYGYQGKSNPIAPCRRSIRATLKLRSYAFIMVFAAAVVLLLEPVCIRAQNVVHDHKGKEFWVAFMANLGGEGEDGIPELALYISSETPTTVRITYNETGKTITVPILSANIPVEVNINLNFGFQPELQAFNQGNSYKSFYVQADADITLYGTNVEFFSSDAFLSLPDDVMTGRYIILAYPNGYVRLQFGGSTYDTPSQFCVIGIEGGTTVTITPSALLNSRMNRDPFQIGLNRGEVFFGQAQTGSNQDVTGTQVRANKPVAVYSGNRRTGIPQMLGRSRDHLVEQMPPLEVWGNNVILTPFYDIAPNVNFNSVARIIAAFDNTTWTLDGAPQPPLQAGKSVEITMGDGPNIINASQPIMVAQYEHSADDWANSSDEFEVGDPFMMFIPPLEQFDSAYPFQSVTNFYFTRHFINVVIPSQAIPSLRLDGQPVVASFVPVQGTRFQYAQIPVARGSHYITSDSAFGLYIYGYGEANSYGYPGGMLFRTLVHDFQGPEIGYASACSQLQGIAYDSRITDTGIDSCYFIGSLENVSAAIEPFEPGADTVRYTAALIDPYQDGVVEIKAIDKEGRSGTQRNTFPGFTVATVGMVGENPIWDSLTSYNGERFCRSIALRNYGKFTRRIEQVSLTPAQDPFLTVWTNMPLDIGPGEEKYIDICYSGLLADSVLNVAVAIDDGCIKREVALLAIRSLIDTSAPGVFTQIDQCTDDYRVAFTEVPGLSSGLEWAHIDTLINATGSLSPDPGNFPANRVELRLRPKDYRRDMIYQMAVRDQARNVLVVRDTISGFTLAIQDAQTHDQVAIRLESDWEGDSVILHGTRCDSILLVNYGTGSIYIDDVVMRGNTRYSIPPSQLPLLIAAGETRRIAVCVQGEIAGEQIDTLLLLDSCGREEAVLMRTPVASLYGVSRDRCNTSLSIQNNQATKRTFLTFPVPNPTTTGLAYVDIGMTHDASVMLDILDVNGDHVATVLAGDGLDAGITRVQFDVSWLETGAYFCRMFTSGGERAIQKLIISR